MVKPGSPTNSPTKRGRQSEISALRPAPYQAHASGLASFGFAALDNLQQQPWVLWEPCPSGCLQGSPDVLALLANNPFPGRFPADYIRPLLFTSIRFTDLAEHNRMVRGGRRQLVGHVPAPHFSLANFKPVSTVQWSSVDKNG